jgi:hypothetical protein
MILADYRVYRYTSVDRRLREEWMLSCVLLAWNWSDHVVLVGLRTASKMAFGETVWRSLILFFVGMKYF